jgi:serine/threonine protein kinase
MVHYPPMVDAGAAPIDRYVVLEYLSEGGMGAIYVGKKLGAGGFEKEVVLKQLLPEYTKQEEFIELFLREAKLSATLDHANIVHTIDLVNAGNEYFIVMEYLPGGDLRTLLRKAKRRGNRFSPGAAIYIAREVLSALSYAHVKRDTDGTPLQLIHRDVSPSNVLLSQNGEVKLTDFGIAKAATHTSQFYKVKGKIGYMSPEQARSQELDHRSDLYSLAVCFYEVLTGERLFIHAGLTTSADEIYSQPVPSVSRKIPGLPVELDKIVWKSLMIDPAERYQTAGEFQEALVRCAHRNGLLISAPELASQLREACGPAEGWRDEEDEEVEQSRRAGTEIYSAADDEEDEDFSAIQQGPGRRDRSVKLTVPELLQGIELTSIIKNIAELMDEGRAREDSRPLRAPPGAAGAQRGAELPGVAPSSLFGPGGAAGGASGPGGPSGPTAASPPRSRSEPLPGLPNQAPAPTRLPTPAPLPGYPSPGVGVGQGQGGQGGQGAGRPGPNPGPSPRSPEPSPAYPRFSAPMGSPTGSSMGSPMASVSASSGGFPHAAEDPRHIKPWMVIAAIVVVGAVIAAVVGLSGPNIATAPPPPPVSPRTSR